VVGDAVLDLTGQKAKLPGQLAFAGDRCWMTAAAVSSAVASCSCCLRSRALSFGTADLLFRPRGIVSSYS
jgi:hypothetical protein